MSDEGSRDCDRAKGTKESETSSACYLHDVLPNTGLYPDIEYMEISQLPSSLLLATKVTTY